MSNEALRKYHQLHYDRSDKDIPRDDEIYRLYQVTEALDFEPNVEEAWIRVQSRMEAPSSRNWMKIAASLVFLVAAAWVIYLNFPQEVAYTTYKTENNVLEITLPDQSDVTLNKFTTITFPEKFDDQRLIRLDGEAFFEVVKADVPFIVEAGISKTTVVGTAFNLQHRRAQTEVHVTEGIVRFGIDRQQIEVSRGQSAILESEQNSLTLDKLADPNDLAWVTNKFSFEEVPMNEVVTTLENHFETTIEFSSKRIGNCLVTGTFENKELYEILRSIGVVLDLKVETRKNQYLLKGKGC